MAFEGSCHCGKVTFRVEAEAPKEAISCNCSHCRRKGLLLAFFPRAAFKLTGDEDATSSYRFNSCKIDHRVCNVCGTQAFAFGSMPDGTATAAVNLRCVPAMDLDRLILKPFDGASL
jgi:hypothetical protein